MFSRIWFINFVLAVSVIFFGIKAYGVWSEEEKGPSVKGPIERSSSRPEPRIMKRKIPNESDYRAVVEKNLFSATRLPPDLKKEEKPEVVELKEIKISGRKIYLYGVVLTDDYKGALVENPDVKPGGRPQKWVKAGDTLGDFRVAAINKDRIILEDDAKQYEILLHDKNKPRSGAAVTKKPVVPTVVTSGSKKSMRPPKVPRPKLPKKEELAEGEYEIVNTPFGKIKRRIK